eukprot:758784-Hanusia_phi.AAC.11
MAVGNPRKDKIMWKNAFAMKVNQVAGKCIQVVATKAQIQKIFSCIDLLNDPRQPGSKDEQMASPHPPHQTPRVEIAELICVRVKKNLDVVSVTLSGTTEQHRVHPL